MVLKVSSLNLALLIVPLSVMVIGGLIAFDVIDTKEHKKVLDDVIVKSKSHFGRIRRKFEDKINNVVSEI